jgi:hypothetical protein
MRKGTRFCGALSPIEDEKDNILLLMKSEN